MVATTKKRSAGFVVNKTGESQRFQNYLQMVSGTHAHFATTLNQNPHTFLDLYNEFHMTNAQVTAEQEELGLKNQAKVGLFMTLLLVSKQYNEPIFGTIDFLDRMIDYQLPTLKEGGLRFVDEEKTVLMAAAWYSWYTSSHKGSALDDVVESFYDILWFFLEPIDQSRQVNFDRDGLKKMLEQYLPKKEEPNKLVEPAPAPAQFADRVASIQNGWFAARSKGDDATSVEEFNTFVAHGAANYNKAIKKPRNERWMQQNSSDENLTVTRIFEDGEALMRSYSGFMLLPNSGFHANYLNNLFMDDMAQQVVAKFYQAGYTISQGMLPGNKNEMAALSVFHTWTALFSHANHLDITARSESEQHLKWGAEMALIAENLVFTINEFFVAAGFTEDRQSVIDKAIVSVLDFMVEAAAKANSISSPEIENSIFNIGAASFYNNLSSIITKETEMSKQAQTIAASAPAIAAAAAAGVVAAAAVTNEKTAEQIQAEAALNDIMGGMEKRIGAAMEESGKKLIADITKLVHDKNVELTSRLEKLEAVVGQTADKTKLDEVGKEMLESIRKAGKEVVKSANKKKSKKSVTGVEELTLTEKVVVGVGLGAVAGAIGYGVYRLADHLMGE